MRFGSSQGATWVPHDPHDSHLWQLMERLEQATPEDLQALAVGDPERWWATVVEYFGLVFSQPWTQVLDSSRGVPFPRWWIGARINVVETCLFGGDPAADAVVSVDEAGTRQVLSRAELLRQVQALAGHLHARGVRSGDAVGICAPMVPQTTVAFFACAWLGAVAVPAFSGFGASALATRLLDSGAVALITGNLFERKGQNVDLGAVSAQALTRAPNVRIVVCTEEYAPHGWTSWSEALGDSEEVAPAALDANDPLMLLYTSGTTGRPKGIVHSHGGFLVKAVADLGIALDLRADDRLLWVTDVGWLVAPLVMVGASALRATAVHRIGAPDHPALDSLWQACEEQRVTMLGLSPSAVRRAATAPPPMQDLSQLRAFISTGEPWDAASWDWLFTRVGREQLPILNYAGGTEVGGGILTCYGALPVRACSFTGPLIGMDADVVSPGGEPLTDAVGELVVRNIWPGMTHSFWGPDDERYLETYWSQLPGVWWHGDLARRSTDGWWTLEGRSDDTLKVAGRRIGPGEVEGALLTHPSVSEAAVVGVPHEAKGQAMVAFVVLASQAAEGELLAHVRSELGRSLTPDRVITVDALPRTRSGKVVRRAVRAVWLGQDPGDLSGLENPGVVADLPRQD